jgi:hypothetical protein
MIKIIYENKVMSPFLIFIQELLGSICKANFLSSVNLFGDASNKS